MDTPHHRNAVDILVALVDFASQENGDDYEHDLAQTAADEIRANRTSMAELEAQLKTTNDKYHELISAVVTKIPNQSRHETALGYIRSAERGENNAQSLEGE